MRRAMRFSAAQKPPQPQTAAASSISRSPLFSVSAASRRPYLMPRIAREGKIFFSTSGRSEASSSAEIFETSSSNRPPRLSETASRSLASEQWRILSDRPKSISVIDESSRFAS